MLRVNEAHNMTRKQEPVEPPVKEQQTFMAYLYQLISSYISKFLSYFHTTKADTASPQKAQEFTSTSLDRTQLFTGQVQPSPHNDVEESSKLGSQHIEGEDSGNPQVDGQSFQHCFFEDRELQNMTTSTPNGSFVGRLASPVESPIVPHAPSKGPRVASSALGKPIPFNASNLQHDASLEETAPESPQPKPNQRKLGCTIS